MKCKAVGSKWTAYFITNRVHQLMLEVGQSVGMVLNIETNFGNAVVMHQCSRCEFMKMVRLHALTDGRGYEMRFLPG